MAGPKAQTPAPIDRPLSRAYLRQFVGWSTAYPPGLSQPNSLRIMENVQINRDGSARVRPGLRYLSYDTVPTVSSTGLGAPDQLVGTHEAFYLNDGTKAYLFAVRESDGTVGFRVLVIDVAGSVIRQLTDAGVDFALPQGAAAVNFTAATTYVKYLQIDNKIFALSNAGEPMRLFFVGVNKSAKALASITRPDWTVADKLTVVHPDANWITTGGAGVFRTNKLRNPSFENSLDGWFGFTSTTLIDRVDIPVPPAAGGSRVLRMRSLPTRTNLLTHPLHQVSTVGPVGWEAEPGSSLTASGSYAQVSRSSATAIGDKAWALGPLLTGVVAGQIYKVAYDSTSSSLRPGLMRVRFYGANGAQVGPTVERQADGGTLRWESRVTAPPGAVAIKLDLGALCTTTGVNASAGARNVMICADSEDSTFFTGSSGTNYFWTGTANASQSVYHPPLDVSLNSELMPVSPGTKICASAYVRGTVARTLQYSITFVDASNTPVAAVIDSASSDTSTGWTRLSLGSSSIHADAVACRIVLHANGVPRGEEHYVDAMMLEPGVDVPGDYFDGGTTNTSTVTHTWSAEPHSSTSVESTSTDPTSIPPAETRTAETLISDTKADNVYNFGFFYTFSNEVGESAASMLNVVRGQRGWAAWTWETPDPTGAPSGTYTGNPDLVCDQLVAIVPDEVFTTAKAQGALSWSLYMFTWSDQDAVPVTAVKVGTKPILPDSTRERDGWIRVTPVVSDTGSEVTGLPSATNRYNYSDPARGGQGLVAADRMVVVLDPTAAAVVRWTSNLQGEYTNFTANLGGGYKTLTSGNLMVPACVKLWQNPQSVDTLTILCLGTDGHSTGYYMAPSQVASQSEAVNIMGFEETTATPGTTSPYAVEVFNNSLYHPLDDQLMKSTASNYNINHLSVTDAIRDGWERLTRKQQMISAVHDNRLHYIVHNPAGAPLEDGCNGNEIWVFDAQAKAGSWSRYLIQAHSMRKIEFGGRVYMSVVRPDGIFYLDPDYGLDDVVGPGRVLSHTAIAWKLETNTQGANRAHDAWAHVQQANITLGQFSGVMRYGIRARDIHGKDVEIAKEVHDTDPRGTLAYDLDDNLLVRRDLREWFFFAESVTDDGGAVLPSFGQINYVQYRYTPSTVNTGYEHGSVETFQYGAAAAGTDSYTTNGTPVPMIDTRRP